MATINEYVMKAPCFTGFYGYELFSDQDELTNLEGNYPDLYNELCKKNLFDKFLETIYCNLDWEKTYENISEQLVDQCYSKIFNPYVEKIEFSHLWSPKCYNYYNDEIYIKITLTDDQLNEIELFCFGEEKKCFNDYLESKYTSRDGFISFISNNIQEFKETYRKLKSTEDDGFVLYLGILFEFFMKMNSDKDSISLCDCESIYEAIEWQEAFDEKEIAEELLKEINMETTFEKLIRIKFWFVYSEELENLNFLEREYLENQAKEQIFKMVKEGYTSGELCESVNDQEFYGWWEYGIENK
jgi:hypothetical protein